MKSLVILLVCSGPLFAQCPRDWEPKTVSDTSCGVYFIQDSKSLTDSGGVFLSVTLRVIATQTKCIPPDYCRCLPQWLDDSEIRYEIWDIGKNSWNTVKENQILRKAK